MVRYFFCRSCWTHLFGVAAAEKHASHDLRYHSGFMAASVNLDAELAEQFIAAIDKAIQANVEGDVTSFIDDLEF